MRGWLRGRAGTFESDTKGAWTYADRAGRDWRSPGFPQNDQHPVVCVNHADAMAYINWINHRTKGGYRLPSPSYSSLHRVIDGLTCGRGIAVRNFIAQADRICWA